MITAREGDHELAARRGPGDPDGTHHRLRPGRGEAQALDRGHPVADPLAELDLERAGRTEREPVAQRCGDRADDRRVGVPEDGRSPAADVVEIPVAVHVPDVRATPRGEDKRIPAYGPEGADGAVDAAREEVRGTLAEVGLGAPRGAGECGHCGPPIIATNSSMVRRRPSRIGRSLTVERRLSVPRSSRTSSPNLGRSSVS